MKENASKDEEEDRVPVVESREEEAVEEQDLPREITFEKRSIPKSRTQSVQSVLSSVSLKSFVQQQHNQNNPNNNNKAFVAPPSQNNQANKHINATSYIQAPATAGSSKRRASFEIGQRLPFNKDDAVESDGEAELQEEQKKLTDDALRRLSSFSKFQPAEVDFKKKLVSNSLNRTGSVLLSRKPQSNPSSASQLRETPFASPSTSFKQHIPPTLLHQNSQQQLHHQQQQQYSPQSNSTPTSNSAPPMSKTNSSSSTASKITETSSLRTINDPKRPMYIPAVLRQSHTNLKPEDLKFINEQKLQRKTRSSSSILTNTNQQLWKFKTISQNNLNQLTQPTRIHWKKDFTRSKCAYCSKNFTFFERRHHCRRCGDIFCNEHVSNYLNLGPDAKFCLDVKIGVLSKVCDYCFKDYEGFLKEKFGNVDPNTIKKSIEDQETTTSTAAIKTGNNDRNGSVSGSENAVNVGSIPADWTWSSF